MTPNLFFFVPVPAYPGIHGRFKWNQSSVCFWDWNQQFSGIASNKQKVWAQSLPGRAQEWSEATSVINESLVSVPTNDCSDLSMLILSMPEDMEVMGSAVWLRCNNFSYRRHVHIVFLFIPIYICMGLWTISFKVVKLYLCVFIWTNWHLRCFGDLFFNTNRMELRGFWES